MVLKLGHWKYSARGSLKQKGQYYSMTFQRSTEPVCCCCGVKIGLQITYAIFAFLGIILILDAARFSFDGFLLIEGLLVLCGAIIGLSSISNTSRSRKLLNSSFYISPLIGITLLSVVVTEYVFYGEAYVRDTNRLKISNPSITDDEVESNNRAIRTSLAIDGIIRIGIGAIVYIVLRNRTIAYINWIDETTSRSNDPYGESGNSFDAELRTIAESTIKG
eukprot:NODE_658_length_5456_cov_0.429158.p2 type:complete len:220 gc:universal NODE_658_length_5456_cov_0.429158:2212-1553(-)